MAKTIIFCADGTWNNPDQHEDTDSTPDPTNVYKLFLNLDGQLCNESLRQADEQERAINVAGVTQQIAKYLHGVGDSRNPIKRIMGGACGAGLIARIVRGYTFISRNYEPGAQIVITGFSRGAYTARALTGLIVSQGVLRPELTVDKEQAYRSGAQAWYRYRKATMKNAFSLACLAEVAADLPAFLSCGKLEAEDLVPVDRIAAVGVWDTVGALGIPASVRGTDVDAFQFVDNRLSNKVVNGFHAVALDEQRVDFTPSLWEPATNVTQRLFPGAHADVGGGYPVNDLQSGLSDRSFDWMCMQLSTIGVQFATQRAYVSQPNAAGCAHQPWAHMPWTLPNVRKEPRTFTNSMSLDVDASITQRRDAGPVCAEPGTAAAAYRPSNLPGV